MKQQAIFLFGAVLVSGGLAGGAEFHPIASIQSSTAATDFYAVGNLVQGVGVGFDASEPHGQLGTTSGDLWVTDDCSALPCDYFTEYTPPVLTVDLGRDVELGEISLWNYTDSNDNGARKVGLRFATESEGVGGFGGAVSYEPSFSLLQDEGPRQSFLFSERVVARYVEVVIRDNYFAEPGTAGGDRVGLGEVAFEVLPASVSVVVATAPNELDLKSALVGDLVLNGFSLEENYWSVVADSRKEVLYLSVPTEERIYEMDVYGSPSPVEFVHEPGAVFHGLAVNEADGILYALDSASDSLLSYDLATGEALGVVGNATGFIRPNEVILDAKRGWLITSDSGTDSIRFYTLGGSLLGGVSDATTVGVWGLAIEPTTGDLLYSSHDNGAIYRYDPDGGSNPVLEQSGLSGPRGLWFDRAGRFYCVESGLDRILAFGPGSFVIYDDAKGGRDVTLVSECDLNGNFIPDDWEEANGFPELSFYEDFDGDGVTDGVEVAMGGDAMGGEAAFFEVGPDGEGQVVVEHEVLKKSDFDYGLWLSEDLVRWRKVNELGAVTSGMGLYDTVSYAIGVGEMEAMGMSGEERLFGRVVVEPRE